MATLDEVLRRIKTLKPPRYAAGNEVHSIDGPIGMLDAWALIEAVRICCDLPQEYQGILKQLGEFVRRSAPLKFTKLDRATVAVQLLARVLNNSLVSQESFGICGPAAIAMETAHNRPLEYCKIATQLAEDGQSMLGKLVLKPNQRILDYDPGKSIPQVDWMVCASIRNESTNLEKEFSKEVYGGSTLEEVFHWMVKAGYRNVIGVCHQVFAQAVFAHPSGIRPPGLLPEDKDGAFRTLKELRAKGWHIFMGCNMSLQNGIQQMKMGETFAREMEGGEAVLEQTKKKVVESLGTENLGRFQTLVKVGKSLVTGGSVGEGHWVYLEQLDTAMLDESMFTVTVCSHGQRFRSVNVPAAGFINKYYGFVAVTDLA